MQKQTPEKIITTKVDLKQSLSSEEVKKYITNFQLDKNQTSTATKLVKAMYSALIKKDASLIEINPLVITKNNEILCLDAKMNFDDNAIFKHPEILGAQRFK